MAQPLHPVSEDRVQQLVARFDGAIKYRPMLESNHDWSDEQAVAFARQWHTVAIDRLKKSSLKDRWNDRIPYCRNIPTAAMLTEARR